MEQIKRIVVVVIFVFYLEEEDAMNEINRKAMLSEYEHEQAYVNQIEIQKGCVHKSTIIVDYYSAFYLLLWLSLSLSLSLSCFHSFTRTYHLIKFTSIIFSFVDTIESRIMHISPDSNNNNNKQNQYKFCAMATMK